jgi:alpha galactosidase A-like protein/alpha galactosidase C-like protein/fibronectin type III domain protein/carbohydrate binding protein with CBM35 domain
MAGRLRRRILLTFTLPTLAASVAVLAGTPAGATAAPNHTTGQAAATQSSTAHGAPTRVKQEATGATPYMGWSSWSLESTNYPGVNPTGSASWLTEQHVLQQADVMAAELKSHGYEYVNIDAGWANNNSQGGCCSFGTDPYGRPIPDPTTFPDGIKYIADYVHAKGLKLGIYLAVGLNTDAYNGGATPIYGTTNCHTSDIVYPDLRKTNGWTNAYKIDYASPCAQAYINSIADELAGWGVDFLKLDGVGPGSFQGGPDYDNTSDVAAWSAAFAQSGRQIQFVISWALAHPQEPIWQEYTNGWRIDTDVECYCGTLVTWNNSVKQRWDDVVQWIPDAGPGHWNNLDSLDVGDGRMDGITDAERQSYMTLWAIEGAPLYTGDDLTKLDAYGLSLLTNDEVIAVDQAGDPAKPVSQTTDQQVWYARNADGSYTVALFNLGGSTATVTANWNDLGIIGRADVRDLWSHTDLGSSTGSLGASLPTHGSRLLRITPKNAGATPTMPTDLHGTSDTGTTMSLAWDPSAGAASYDVDVNGTKNVTVTGTSATIAGLAPATGYRFSVIAKTAKGHASPTSETLSLTTPADESGPTTYEAEAPTDTIGGGAQVYSCSGCSGGAKVGYLGYNGYLVFNNVTVPVAGTYLVTVGYVDGDSSRTAIVTVDGTSFELPLPGTNDNNWNSAQTVTIPVQLSAGANSIRFDNPNGWVSDIDKIAL